MKKEIPQWMLDAHAKAKQEWAAKGSVGDFYEYLLNTAFENEKEDQR